MPARETTDFDDPHVALFEAAEAASEFVIIEPMVHRPKKAAEQQPPTSARPKSKALLAETFTHPQGSPQRLQVFSKFLKALRDENAR